MKLVKIHYTNELIQIVLADEKVTQLQTAITAGKLFVVAKPQYWDMGKKGLEVYNPSEDDTLFIWTPGVTFVQIRNHSTILQDLITTTEAQV